VKVQPAPETLTRELLGRTAPYQTVEVRARVSGIVQGLFAEGADVKEGQVLFRIDPARYEAAYDSARAKLALAEARVAMARLPQERKEDLVRSDEVTQRDHEHAVAARGEAEANVAAARAAVATACINLGYTAVTSPVAGRIGRAAVAEGAYAQQAPATLLATVQQLDPMYVEVTQSSAEVTRLRADLAAGRLRRTDSGAVRVTLVLEDGSKYREEGSLQFSDVAVDQGTGSITLRAIFPNPRRELLPGVTVRARMEEVVDPTALLVPQAAVRWCGGTRGCATAFVVDPGDHVEARALEIGRSVGDDWLVTAGVLAGDRVVVDGVQRIRAGEKVRPVLAPELAAKP
jgi:membrane fusion protein (multidrug efflux system)